MAALRYTPDRSYAEVTDSHQSRTVVVNGGFAALSVGVVRPAPGDGLIPVSRQRDVSFKPLPSGGVSRIRCDIDTFTNCLSSQQLTKPYTPTAFNCVTPSQ